MNSQHDPITLEYIQTRARAQNLDVLGAFHPSDDDGVPANTGTLALLGPAEPGFWAGFSKSAERLDQSPDPLDRWSARVIGCLAGELGGTAIFPFSGPPFMPFISWAKRSGRAWTSPVGLLVHETAGLFVSYRGAIAFTQHLPLPPHPQSPCSECLTKPCLAACPAGALTGQGYDFDACHSYLDTTSGKTCMQRGCAVRRSCPISERSGRLPAQSEFHMRAFHK